MLIGQEERPRLRRHADDRLQVPHHHHYLLFIIIRFTITITIMAIISIIIIIISTLSSSFPLLSVQVATLL